MSSLKYTVVLTPKDDATGTELVWSLEQHVAELRERYKDRLWVTFSVSIDKDFSLTLREVKS